MVKLQEFRKQFFITVPRSIAKAKSMRKGQDLDWKLDNIGRLFLLEGD
jgi:hypothetical protein